MREFEKRRGPERGKDLLFPEKFLAKNRNDATAAQMKFTSVKSVVICGFPLNVAGPEAAWRAPIARFAPLR